MSGFQIQPPARRRRLKPRLRTSLASVRIPIGRKRNRIPCLVKLILNLRHICPAPAGRLVAERHTPKPRRPEPLRGNHRLQFNRYCSRNPFNPEPEPLAGSK